MKYLHSGGAGSNLGSHDVLLIHLDTDGSEVHRSRGDTRHRFSSRQ